MFQRAPFLTYKILASSRCRGQAAPQDRVRLWSRTCWPLFKFPLTPCFAFRNIVTTSSSNSKKLKRLTRKCTSASDGPKKGETFFRGFFFSNTQKKNFVSTTTTKNFWVIHTSQKKLPSFSSTKKFFLSTPQAASSAR